MTDGVVAPRPAAAGGGRSHVRGSTLLLGGRMIALLLNFVTQVATVRYLTKDDFGAFAWALSIVAITTRFNLLGLPKSVARFIPIYEERGEGGLAIGSIFASVVAIVGVGAAVVVGSYGVLHFVGAEQIADPAAVELLLWLVVLTPLQALDNLLQSVAAVFVGARAIFFRRHLLVPLLRVAVIGGVIAVDGSVTLLAIGQVVIGALGVVAYVSMLARHSRRTGLFDRARRQGLGWRRRELLGYSLPLLSSDVVLAVHASVAVLILHHVHGSTPVAALRAVAPVAALCLVAIDSFRLLYIPATSRMFAKGDHTAVRETYWDSALWISVFSFPVCAVACFLATPVTTLLFGERYASSGALLALLAAGNYVNSCTGLNLYTLQVYGKLRVIFVSNVIGVGLQIAYCFLLVPPYGALGAAIATMLAMITLNVLHQLALARSTRVGGPSRDVAVGYVRIAVALATLAFLRMGVGESVWILVPAIALATVWLIAANRHALKVDETFPELRRLSKARWRSRDRGESTALRVSSGAPATDALRFGRTRFYYRALDGVLSSRMREDSAPVMRRSSNFDRAGRLTWALHKRLPRATARLLQAVERTDRLPFRALEPATPIGFGGEATCYRIESQRPHVLKVYRESLGLSLPKLREIAQRRHRDIEKLRRWYTDVPGLIPPTCTMIVHGPIRGARAVAQLQRYVAPHEAADLLADRTDAELVELLEATPRLREEFAAFAHATRRAFEEERDILDIVGRDNVLLERTSEGPKLLVLDVGLMDVERMRRDRPQVYERLVAALERMERIAGLAGSREGTHRPGRSGGGLRGHGGK